MSNWLRLLLLISLLSSTLLITAQEEAPATPTVLARPPAITSLNNEGIVLERYFGVLKQGTVGVLRIIGDDIVEARAVFRGREFPFLPIAGDGWYALLVADIDASPRDFPLAIVVRRGDDRLVNFEALVTIESAGFIRQNFEVPPAIGFLIDPEVERNELARLDALIAHIRPQRLWGATAWQLPIDTNFTSGFGQYRILNQSVQTRHTGWDQSAVPGTPVAAMAAGEVVFAGQLDIRGNYIMIDHGWGVYSGYAHLSQINVQRGQTIEQGQIIAGSGNSGRSGGPHLHWEIAVSGEWVDGAAFLEMWLP